MQDILHARPITGFEQDLITRLAVLVREDEGVRLNVFDGRIALLTEGEDTLACAAHQLARAIEDCEELSWEAVTGKWALPGERSVRISEELTFAEGDEAQEVANLTGCAITDGYGWVMEPEPAIKEEPAVKEEDILERACRLALAYEAERDANDDRFMAHEDEIDEALRAGDGARAVELFNSEPKAVYEARAAAAAAAAKLKPALWAEITELDARIEALTAARDRYADARELLDEAVYTALDDAEKEEG